ncbi:hypothetical protein CspeluHIS016_0800410 [Cutaneotrichosporon spelunceum]|uniref:CFEM domain-containing protein n=1 Tax=Cutaneotrichosporon spelunceum TaxID=1672016 RepID=A0AAD3YDP7_9TREE|nr:hypothetical protein CspeluHIS016_0800410 [Cutaneotrichosporon spelunceum]
MAPVDSARRAYDIDDDYAYPGDNSADDNYTDDNSTDDNYPDDTLALPAVNYPDGPYTDVYTRGAALAHANYRRQSDATGIVGVPGCMTRCMRLANTGHCASNADFLCLCANHDYQASVTQCWATKCNATSYNLALSYASAACTAIGARMSASGNGASTNLTMQPIVYSRAAFNIQAVMSGLCSLVLLCAIGLGVLSCRAQARRQALSSTMSATAKSRVSVSRASGVSRLPRSYFPGREVGQISTLDMGSVDFGKMFEAPARRARRPRFTNRLPGERAFTNRQTEEWEMEDRASGAASGSRTHDRDEDKEDKGPASLDTGSEARYGESTAPLNPEPQSPTPQTPTPQTPSTVYMAHAPSAASLPLALKPVQYPLELEDDPPRTPPAPRALSVPPSPKAPQTYASGIVHAQ